MLPVAFPLAGRLLRRLRAQAGMTMVETMVAAVILSAGVLGVFVMVETSDKVNDANRGRETATSLSRELLESAHAIPFSMIGDSNWFNSTLTGLDGRSSNVVSPTSGSQRTNVTRRGYTYTVDVAACSVDDGKDSYGSHGSGINWCSDSASAGASDAQPEDLKRVAVTTSWTQNSRTYNIYQTATFSSAGAVIGPSLGSFLITTPSDLDQSAPVITTNPTGGNVIFTATSTGAADMKFSVDGVEQVTGAAGGNGTWTYTWNISALKDGVYTIGATAIDALGTRGDPQFIQVKLARGAASAVTNVTGGYNDVYSAGTKTRVVELAWDGAPEGSVTGYTVYKGATQVCGASVVTECMDLSPASTGTTTYSIRTLYNDASGNPGYVSTNYDVTAPAAGSGSSNVFNFTDSATISRTKCMVAPTTVTRPGRQVDALTATNAGVEKQWTYATEGNVLSGCMPPFTTPANLTASGTGITTNLWAKNTLTGTVACRLQVTLYKGTAITTATPYGGNAVSGSAAFLDIPANTTAITKFTQSVATVAGSFAIGDQLSILVGGFSANTSTNKCGSTTLYWNSSTHPLTVALNTLTGGGIGGGTGPGTITRPAAPTGLTGVANGDGTTTLSWSAPGGSPAADFYRIYRDGQNYTDRLETTGDTGTGTITWTDGDTGGTTHVYRVTAASSVLAESDPAGPLTR